MANLDTPVFKQQKWSLKNKTGLLYSTTIVLTLLVGIILTHGVDDYINNHTFIYQSPIVITQRMVSPVVITVAPAKETMAPIATQEAQPTVNPKGSNLR